MTGYHLPTTTDWVTASWQDHKDRTPPSSEPGTDYGAAYGSDLYAVEAGTVTYVKTTNSGAMGRVIEYALDDGRHTRSLHLSEVWVSIGERVARGQRIGRTGASGYDSDWGYGAHLHQTLWPGPAWAAPTIDFELYVGGPPPTPPDDEEDTMPAMKGVNYQASSGTTVHILFNEASGFYVEHSGVPGEYNNSLAQCWETNSWPTITEAHAKVIKAALDKTRADASAQAARSQWALIAIAVVAVTVLAIGIALIA